MKKTKAKAAKWKAKAAAKKKVKGNAKNAKASAKKAGSNMSRTPPASVRRELRREVGFVCPVDGCESPYLTWHHFDPPWKVRKHHDPAGLVALCGQHHGEADEGAFTDDQLREFKKAGAGGDRRGVGRFNWMRRRLLGVVGGNYYYDRRHEVLNLILLDGQPIVTFRRDEAGYVLVSVRMPSLSKDPRIVMQDNDWLLVGSPADFECPARAPRFRARYEGGDELSVEFFEIADEAALLNRYPDAPIESLRDPPEEVRRLMPQLKGIDYPTTAVEVCLRIGGTEIEITRSTTTVGKMSIGGGAIIDSGPDCLSLPWRGTASPGLLRITP